MCRDWVDDWILVSEARLREAIRMNIDMHSLLVEGGWTRGVGPMRPGVTNLPAKQDRYRTTRGVLTLEEYNRLSREFTPTLCSDAYRFLCADWVKYHYTDPRAEEMFRLEQQHSRLLKDKGAALRREDIESLRGRA